MLTREQILAAEDVRTETVDVPEWGGPVKVRSMCVADRLRLNSIKTEGVDARVIWIVATLVDDSGAPLFKADDVEALMKKSVAATDRVYEVIKRLNGLGAAAVEQAAKN